MQCSRQKRVVPVTLCWWLGAKPAAAKAAQCAELMWLQNSLGCLPTCPSRTSTEQCLMTLSLLLLLPPPAAHQLLLLLAASLQISHFPCWPSRCGRMGGKARMRLQVPPWLG